MTSPSAHGHHDHGGDHDHHDPHDHGHHDHHDHHDHGGLGGPRTELMVAIGCGVTMAAGFGVEHLLPAAPAWLSTTLYVAAFGQGSFFTLGEAWENLRQRRFEIDTLMLVAAAGAASLGAWAEGALLLFLFSLGHALEHHALGRAKQAIRALADLAPRTALRRVGGGVEEVAVEALAIGDHVIVKPDSRLPADGFILAGIGSIDQSPVTGEGLPADKEPVPDAHAARADPSRLDPHHRAYAGTINGSTLLEIEVTRTAADSTLARIIRMVAAAQTRTSPTQNFTQSFQRLFVPAVLGLVTLLLFAWVVVDEPFRDSFYRAMAVLVAASPCALAIATPSAVLSGIARAARGGVLVKGGGPLELLGGIRTFAFDKTGTLTAGRPRLTDLWVAPGGTEAELLVTAAAVEGLSDHPLARAITRDANAMLGATPPPARDLVSLTGKGLMARVDGEPVLIGKPELFGTDGIAPLSAAVRDAADELRAAGRTTMAVRRGDRDLGVIGIMDSPRAEAAPTLARLRALGVDRIVMISGDSRRVADAVAAQVGVTEVWGDLLPDDKLAAIRNLRDHAPVAMVGDGVNDAPAMAAASVGIAMGAAGSDVALEAADVALMADDLSRLPFAVGLSRQTRAIIRQNLFVSLGMVAFLVPATIFGLGIGPAVALHEGSTLLVAFNALRLLAWRGE